MSLEVKHLENILIVFMDKQLVLQPSKLEVISDFKLLIHSLKYGLQNSDILQLLEGEEEEDQDQDQVVLQLVISHA